MATPAPPFTDTNEGDDGALHGFFRFLIRRRLQRLPDFNLENEAELREAIREYLETL